MGPSSLVLAQTSVLNACSVRGWLLLSVGSCLPTRSVGSNYMKQNLSLLVPDEQIRFRVYEEREVLLHITLWCGSRTRKERGFIETVPVSLRECRVKGKSWIGLILCLGRIALRRYVGGPCLC